MKGIKRKRGPTSVRGEGSREVATLRIGLKGKQREKGAAHLGWGDTQWMIPIRTNPKTGQKYLDAAEFTSQPTKLYPNWRHIAKYPVTMQAVEIPTRNFFLISSSEKAYVTRIMNKFFKEVVENQGKGGKR